MLLDSHFEKRYAVSSTLGLPRWHKRIGYYLFKICYLNNTIKKLSQIPNYEIRSYLTQPYWNEYEKYKFFRVIRRNKAFWKVTFRRFAYKNKK